MDYSKPYLGKIVDVKIDRPLGSRHLKHDYIYPINYGFIPNTTAPDGDGLDAYVLGIDKPLEVFTGRCIAIIHRTNDNDDKLVICAMDATFSNKEIAELTLFQEKWFESEIIRP